MPPTPGAALSLDADMAPTPGVRALVDTDTVATPGVGSPLDGEDARTPGVARILDARLGATPFNNPDSSVRFLRLAPAFLCHLVGMTAPIAASIVEVTPLYQ